MQLLQHHLHNQLLQYDTACSKWINYTPTYISSSSIASSTDATITSPSTNQLLQYNSASGKWINATVSTGSSSVSTLTDVVLTSAVSGNVLMYNGTHG